MVEEYVDVVNEKDEVTGKDLKSNKKIKNFISRTVAIFIFDSAGKFIICKRGPHKKNDPNIYDVSTYGNVVSGENYKEAAERELFEEISIKTNLTFLHKYYRELDSNGQKTAKIFCAIFCGKSDQEPKLNNELSGYKKLTFSEIEKEIIERPQDYCQGFKDDFSKVKHQLLEYVK